MGDVLLFAVMIQMTRLQITLNNPMMSFSEIPPLDIRDSLFG